MNTTLTHYEEGLVEIITDRYTVWDYVDEGTGYGQFEGTKAECEGFMANAQLDNYTRLEISESGYDNEGGLMDLYPSLLNGHTKSGMGCVSVRMAQFTETMSEGFYPVKKVKK